MREAIRLAGFMAAQAIHLVGRSGKSLPPLIIFEKEDGNTHFVEIRETFPEEAAKKGTALLRQNAEKANRGVMAFDAYLNLPPGSQTDAIFLYVCEYVPEYQQAIIAVPYRHKNKPGGFAVHQPTFIQFHSETFPTPEMIRAFTQGVEGHTAAAPFWREHLDESDY